MWGLEEAHIVCRRLGFVNGAASFHHYGRGDGPIVLSDLQCNGDESHLMECDHIGFGNHSCYTGDMLPDHNKDVGVKCLKGENGTKRL